MKRNTLAVSNLIFATVIVVLVVVSGVGFGLYESAVNGTTTSHTVTVTTTTDQMMTSTEDTMMATTSSDMMSNTSSSSGAFMFTPESGMMISNAWLITSQAGMDEYAIAIHAQGLEPNGTYIVEGQLSSGAMKVVPISSLSMNMNTSSGSEFQADRNGSGNYWVVIDSNPATSLETVQLLYLPEMSMNNATEVASLSFTSSSMMTTESMMTTTG